MQKKLYRLSLFFVSFIFIINFLANKFYWYFAITWFDMLMHFLGGVFISIFAISLFYKKFSESSFKKFITLVLISVLLIGLAWELYEYVVEYFIRDVDLATIPDSFSDLLFDISGGLVGAAFVWNKIKS